MNNLLASILSFVLVGSLLLNSCSTGTEQIKFKQYYAQGEALYLRHCSNCHQQTGKGLALVYPPLNPSDYLEKNVKSVLCQMKYGTTGEMIVNGKNFNKAMPGVRSLTELEIAEIATYICNTWGHERGIVEIAEVRTALEKCD